MIQTTIISARIETEVYIGFKALLENQNSTVSDFIKSAVENNISTGTSKKTDKDFLIILALTAIGIYALRQIIKMKQLNSIKTNNHDRQ